MLPERIFSYLLEKLVSGYIGKHQVEQDDIDRHEIIDSRLRIPAVRDRYYVVSCPAKNEIERIGDMLVIFDNECSMSADLLYLRYQSLCLRHLRTK